MSSYVNCRIPLGLLIAFILTAGARGAESKPLRVLFIGNSYTYENNLPFVFQSLAQPIRDVKVDMVAEGGATLRRHLDQGKIQERIAEGRYDVVVVQEQSRLGTVRLVEGFSLLVDTAGFDDAIREIAEATRKGKARLVLLSHWPRADEPRNLTPLHNACVTIAKEVNATIAPAGLVWDRLGGDACSELKLYGQDGSHPAPEGTYVTAATLVRAVLGKSPALVAVTNVPLMDGRAQLSGKFTDIVPDAKGVDAINRVLGAIYKRGSSVQRALPNYPPVPLPILPPEIMRSRFDKSFVEGTWTGEFVTFGLAEKATITLDFRTEPTLIRMEHGETGWSPDDKTSSQLTGSGDDGTLKLKYRSTGKDCTVEISLVRVGGRLKGLVRFVVGDGKEWVRSTITLSRQLPSHQK